MLHRLLDIIRSGEDEEIRAYIKSNASLDSVAQRLGVGQLVQERTSVRPDESRFWQSPNPRNSSYDDSPEDINQKEQATMHHPFASEDEDVSGSEMGFSIISDIQEPSTAKRSSFATFSGKASQSGGTPDRRDRFRVSRTEIHKSPTVNHIIVFGNSPFAFADTIVNPLDADRAQMFDLKIPLCLVQPLLMEEERCPMAAVYTDFRNLGRRQVAAGVPLDAILGPPEVELDLYFRERTPDDSHTPAGWACEYMRLLEDLDIFVSLAAIYTFARFMRVCFIPQDGGSQLILCSGQ